MLFFSLAASLLSFSYGSVQGSVNSDISIFHKASFVELLRECWRERNNAAFVERPPHFSILRYASWESNEALKEALNPATPKAPLANVSLSRPLSEAWFFQNNLGMDKVMRSASSVEALKRVVENRPVRMKQLFASNHFTVAHAACMNDNVDVLRFFLSRFPQSISRFISWRRQTALHFAVLYDAVECCRLLLKRGADIYAEDVNGYSPLDLAISIGNVEILKLFVSETDLLARPPPKYASFRQISLLAIEWGLLEQASIFISHGAVAHLTDPETGSNLLHLSCYKRNVMIGLLLPIIPFECDIGGLYPTHVAVFFKNVDMLSHFTRAQFEKTGPFGMNLLYYAAYFNSLEAINEIEQIFPNLFDANEAAMEMVARAHPTALNALIFGTTKPLNIPKLLTFALISHSFRCAEILIRYFPSIFHRIIIDGMPIIQFAFMKQDAKLISFLQIHGFIPKQA